jgi:hypothetical protein
VSFDAAVATRIEVNGEPLVAGGSALPSQAIREGTPLVLDVERDGEGVIGDPSSYVWYAVPEGGGALHYIGTGPRITWSPDGPATVMVRPPPETPIAVDIQDRRGPSAPAVQPVVKDAYGLRLEPGALRTGLSVELSTEPATSGTAPVVRWYAIDHHGRERYLGQGQRVPWISEAGVRIEMRDPPPNTGPR